MGLNGFQRAARSNGSQGGGRIRSDTLAVQPARVLPLYTLIRYAEITKSPVSAPRLTCMIPPTVPPSSSTLKRRDASRSSDCATITPLWPQLYHPKSSAAPMRVEWHAYLSIRLGVVPRRSFGSVGASKAILFSGLGLDSLCDGTHLPHSSHPVPVTRACGLHNVSVSTCVLARWAL